MAKYYSHACEGVPYGLRYPNVAMAKDAALKVLARSPDIDAIQIVAIQLTVSDTVTRPKPALDITDIFEDAFKGITL